jgi:tetratricopeptide (TPR) repeat protein
MEAAADDLERVAAVTLYLCMAHLQSGRLAELIDLGTRIDAEVERAGWIERHLGAPYPPMIAVRGALGCAHSAMGRRQEGQSWMQRALDVAARAKHRYATALVHVMWSWEGAQHGDGESCLEHAALAHRLAEENHFPGPAMMSAYSMGVGHTLLGRPAEGIVCLERGLAMSERLGYPTFRSQAYAGLAQARLDTGDVERAIEACERGLAFSRETGERRLDAELHRVYADALVSRAPRDLDAAERHLTESLALTSAQGAVVFAARAGRSLERVRALR